MTENGHALPVALLGDAVRAFLACLCVDASALHTSAQRTLHTYGTGIFYRAFTSRAHIEAFLLLEQKTFDGVIFHSKERARFLGESVAGAMLMYPTAIIVVCDLVVDDDISFSARAVTHNHRRTLPPLIEYMPLKRVELVDDAISATCTESAYEMCAYENRVNVLFYCVCVENNIEKLCCVTRDEFMREYTSLTDGQERPDTHLRDSWDTLDASCEFIVWIQDSKSKTSSVTVLQQAATATGHRVIKRKRIS